MFVPCVLHQSRARRRRLDPSAAGPLAALLGLALLAPAAGATVLTVTTTDDTLDGACDQHCSLREAVVAANAAPGADVVVLAAGTYGLSRAGAGEDQAETGDLDVLDDLTILGGGAAGTVIDGNALDRLFDLANGAGSVLLELTDLALREGSVDGDGGAVRGGSTANRLALRRTLLTGNGSLGSGDGGALWSQGALEVVASTIAFNQAGGNGGGIAATGELRLTNSTLSSNSADGLGGGLHAEPEIDGEIANSTLTLNVAARGGGVWAQPDPFISVEFPRFRNSVIAGNTGLVADPDCGGTVVSEGYNLLGVGDSCPDFVPAKGDLEGTSASPLAALLGSIDEHGGPTPTHSLLLGSPARDAGNPAVPGSGGGACEAVDQRGVGRPGEGVAARCDIGAFEATDACVNSRLQLCLNDGRFAVTVTWATPQGAAGQGQAVSLSDESGTFWFFDPANTELIVKVLDACSLFDRFWVFSSGLTNVAVNITVRDTVSGQTRTYLNPQGRDFPPILDTNAFATCGP